MVQTYKLHELFAHAQPVKKQPVKVQAAKPSKITSAKKAATVAPATDNNPPWRK